jgi:polyribonucleotide 5'-hydroxyl-kinase
MDAKAAAAHTLGQGQEYRFEVVPGDAVSVQLVGGTAEIFGAEMSQRRAYTFTGPTQEAIFTWHGCTLQVEGACKHAYVAPDTPMQSYMRLHAELEQRRASARERGTDGPRVLVAGGHGCGKGSLCRMLANYASRAAGAPVLVELGVSHGKVGFPGAVAATSVGWPLDIERSSDDTSPLAFWYGHASPQDDVAFYKQRVTKLAEGVARRLEAHPAERQSGLLISGCGWTDGGGFEALLHQVSHFRVDVIVVMADDRLHSQLTAHAAQWSPSPTVRGAGPETLGHIDMRMPPLSPHRPCILFALLFCCLHLRSRRWSRARPGLY